MTKKCTRCGAEKPLSDFHRSKSQRDGHEPRCKTCRSLQGKAHYAANIEHLREVRKAWYEAHREEHSRRVLSKRDKAVHAERTRLWGQTPEGRLKKRENQAARRTEKGSHRDARGLGRFYRDVLERDGMFCHICGMVIVGLEDLHFDHVVPLSRGGLHSLENVKPSHAICNRRKFTRAA